MPRGKHSNHARGPRHPRWNAGRMVSQDGYVKVRVGAGHPLADPNGYTYEHLLVWASAGRSLPATHEILHHRNENKQDNRLSNLRLMTRGGHNALHNGERGRDERGRFIGKARAGRLLDGREHNDMPEVGDAE